MHCLRNGFRSRHHLMLPRWSCKMSPPSGSRRRSVMSDWISRREVLKRFGKGSAGLALTAGVVRGQSTEIVVAGKPVEIAVESISAATARITVLSIEGARVVALPDTGTLVQSRRSAAARGRTDLSLRSVKAGNLVVRFTGNPPTLHID